MFKKLNKLVSKQRSIVVGVMVALIATMMSSTASAALDLSTFVIDMGPIEALFTIILGALAVMFVIRKATKTANRT